MIPVTLIHGPPEVMASAVFSTIGRDPPRNRTSSPSPLRHGSDPHGGTLFQERDEMVAQSVVIRVVEHIHTAPRPGEVDREDLPDGGGRATRHHDDAIGQE